MSAPKRPVIYPDKLERAPPLSHLPQRIRGGFTDYVSKFFLSKGMTEPILPFVDTLVACDPPQHRSSQG
ncbi:MAG: hypothetical protein HRU17_11305 [Polyangiaceae bacterium]|nr:hypothetical protein [Polyangiaceae bacterium]